PGLPPLGEVPAKRGMGASCNGARPSPLSPLRGQLPRGGAPEEEGLQAGLGQGREAEGLQGAAPFEGATALVRIVAGEFKGRALFAPPGEATRPTSDRARQAVFNIL